MEPPEGQPYPCPALPTWGQLSKLVHEESPKGVLTPAKRRRVALQQLLLLTRAKIFLS